MKQIKLYLSFLAVFALLFTSCSKDENSKDLDSDKATLSFGAIVADLAAKSTDKQSAIGDMPECSDDTPAYVEIVLLRGDDEVVGTAANPYRVNLVAGQIFTEEDEALELIPGTYTLNHFSVYNASGDLIWLAPRGGALAAFVDNSLPMDIELGAGVKKYVDVSVLCFDDRDVNLYGYQFFELDINEAFEFCFFANYCTPEGRHFPARYAVDISINGTTIYEGVENNVGRNNNGDLYAEALCFALPNLEEYDDDEDYIDYTITLLDWTEHDDAYGDVENKTITGSLSRADIMANFSGDDDVEYEHFRFGCGDDDNGNGEVPSDRDNDGVPDHIDECPDEAGPASNKGCPEDPNGGDTDSDGDGVVDSKDQCPDTPAGAEVDENGCPIDSDGDGVPNGIDQCPNTESGVTVDAVGCPVDGGEVVCEIEGADAGCSVVYASGTESWVQVPEPDGFPQPIALNLLGGEDNFGIITSFINNGNLVVQLSMDEGVSLDDYVIDISNNNDGSVDVCKADSDIAPPTGDDPDATVVFANTTVSYPYYIRVRANVCEN